MIPLQCLDVHGNVVSDLRCFPEIVVCDISGERVDRLYACGYLCSFFFDGNTGSYNDAEVDDDLLTWLKYCDKIYNRLKNKEKINKIDFEHLVVTKPKTCMKENISLFFTVKLIKFID